MKKLSFRIKTDNEKSEKDKCVTANLKVSVDTTEIDEAREKLALLEVTLDKTTEKANRLVELLREATQLNDSLSNSQFCISHQCF